MPVSAPTLGTSGWSCGNQAVTRRASDVLMYLSPRDESTWRGNLHRCESPIECLALAGLLALFPSAEVTETAKELKDRDDWTFGIIPQMRIHGYRLDFGVLNRERETVHDLECDGREFHQDKRRDCNRDVALWEHGILAYHVSGSSLCRNPLAALEPFGRKVRHG